MNLAILIGRLGRDPELKCTSFDKMVCTFSIATNEKLPKGKGREAVVTWHRIVAWENVAEQARTLKKGQLVQIEGSLRTDKWKDRDGNERETLQIVCQRFRTLDGMES